MGGKSASKQASREAKRARQEEEARQARVAEGTANVNNVFDSQFDDSYFSGIGDAYLDFANPCGCLGGDPCLFGCQRHHLADRLQSVARAYFGHEDLSHDLSPR